MSETKIIETYRVAAITISIIIILIAFLLSIFVTGVVYFPILAVIAGFVSLIIKVRLYNKYIQSVLFNDLDPQKYQNVLKMGKFESDYYLEQIYFSYYTGDYQTVINICDEKLKDKKIKNLKYTYLLFLARSYFDMGDFKNLKLVYDAFLKETQEDSKQGPKIRENYTYFKFVGLFLEGNFLECKELYQKLILQSEVTPYKRQLDKIQIFYTYAVSCYKSNDIENAKSVFLNIVKEAPLINYAKMSKDFLNAIETGKEYKPQVSSVIKQEDYKLPELKVSAKKRKTWRVIRLIIFCMASLMILISSLIK